MREGGREREGANDRTFYRPCIRHDGQFNGVDDWSLYVETERQTDRHTDTNTERHR